jgi:putative transposase
VFLPPYSPDLNPIEYIWKSIKRVLSTLLIESSDHLKHIVKEVFEKLSRKLSFAKGWIEQFDIEL